MNWIWLLIAGIVLIGLIIGVILYLIYRNRQVQTASQNGRDVTNGQNNAVIVNNGFNARRPPQPLSPSNPRPSPQPIPVSQDDIDDIPVQRDYRPYRVVGARDGSWFQVLDRQGDIVASFSTPQGVPTFEAECPQGQVELIGIRSTAEGDRLGPVGCVTDATSNIQYVGQQGNVERVYSLGRVLGNAQGQVEESDDSGCPSGFRQLMGSDGVTGMQNGNTANRLSNGIKFICVTDNQCQFHRDCPDGTVCSGGNCVPVENIADF